MHGRPHRYVIGIGSQRAGSTLLHRVLAACTPVWMHPMKELHYFDVVAGATAFRMMQRLSTHLVEQAPSPRRPRWWPRGSRNPSGRRRCTWNVRTGSNWPSWVTSDSGDRRRRTSGRG